MLVEFHPRAHREGCVRRVDKKSITGDDGFRIVEEAHPVEVALAFDAIHSIQRIGRQMSAFKRLARVWREHDVGIEMTDPLIAVELAEPFVDAGAFGEVAPSSAKGVGGVIFDTVVVADFLCLFVFWRGQNED